MNFLHEFSLSLPSGKKVKVGIRKPTRREIDEADMTYSAYMSECITRGILTKDMLLKKYKDFGGALSEEEVKSYRQLITKMMNLNKDLQKTKSAKKKEEIEKDLETVFSQIQEIEQAQEDLFGRTAEVIARNQTILWLAFLLAYDISGEPTMLFEGVDHEERYDKYSEMEEENLDDAQPLLEKLCLYIAFWYSNKGVGKEEFVALDKFLETEEVDETPKDGDSDN